MKRIFLLLLVSVMPLGGAVGQKPEGDIGPPRLPIFSSRYRADGFSVLLPAEPVITTSKVSRKDGKEQMKRLFKVTMNSVDYTIEVSENLKPGQLLEDFIAKSKVSSQYDPATERKLNVNGFPGKEYSSQTETTIAMVQFLVTEQRLFRFAATGPAAATPVIKDFFDSIKLWETDERMRRMASAEPGEKIYTGKEVDLKARFLTKPEPPYTKDARDNKVEGTVVLRAVMSKSGRIEDIRVLVSLPDGLTEQAIKAARKIKFDPAIKDGKAVSMWIQLEYRFSL